MEKDEFIQHWNYFCSLAKRLDETKDYVYHGFKDNENGNNELINGDVCSDIFKQIIMLSASEFEIVTRIICAQLGIIPKNIIEISKSILENYPKIIDTEIITLFFIGKPLLEWKIIEVENVEKVVGIDWWKAYTSIKHNEIDSFSYATLKNAFFSLSSLYIVDLYLMYLQFDNLYLLHDYPPVYYNCKYAPSDVFAAAGELPDFGNKSAVEKYHEMIDDILIDKDNQ